MPMAESKYKTDKELLKILRVKLDDLNSVFFELTEAIQTDKLTKFVRPRPDYCDDPSLEKAAEKEGENQAGSSSAQPENGDASDDDFVVLDMPGKQVITKPTSVRRKKLRRVRQHLVPIVDVVGTGPDAAEYKGLSEDESDDENVSLDPDYAFIGKVMGVTNDMIDSFLVLRDAVEEKCSQFRLACIRRHLRRVNAREDKIKYDVDKLLEIAPSIRLRPLTTNKVYNNK